MPFEAHYKAKWLQYPCNKNPKGCVRVFEGCGASLLVRRETVFYRAGGVWAVAGPELRWEIPTAGVPSSFGNCCYKGRARRP